MRNKILNREDPILHKVADFVSGEELKTPAFKKILAKLKNALHTQDDGVAIAAPQIGVSKRIFLVNGKTLGMLRSGKSYENMSPEDEMPDMAFINPEIIKLSKKKRLLEEGCLSVRWLYGKVERAEKARVKAVDEDGKAFTIDASGLLAQIFQHEIDHLNGILFIDKAIEIEDHPPEPGEKKQMRVKSAKDAK
jgi:peptide deformylase